MIKLEILYDPSNHAEPLKLTSTVSPALAVLLMSQVITAIAHQQIQSGSDLIVPVSAMTKIQ